MNPSLAFTVSASGANVASGAASANVAIPNSSAGKKPRYIRVHATVAAYIKLGTGAVAAAAGDMIVDPTFPVFLNTSGHTHVAAIQLAAAGTVNITPLED